MNTILYNVNPKWLILLYVYSKIPDLMKKMSAEQININTVETQKVIDNDIPTKVDINNLLSRVRLEQKKENKSNFIFFVIVAFVILAAGITLSL